MSTQARQSAANSPKMKYTGGTQKSDILDTSKTNTYLIAMLQWFQDNLWLPILILAVKTDHSPTGQHYDGCAIDMYPANWQQGEQSTCQDMMTAASKCPFVEAVGLGGITKRWRGNVKWPTGTDAKYFVLFDDNDTDHIHVACANNVDKPGARASATGYTKYTG